MTHFLAHSGKANKLSQSTTPNNTTINRAPTSKPIPKLMDAEHNLLRKNKGCFKCRKFFAGHIAPSVTTRWQDGWSGSKNWGRWGWQVRLRRRWMSLRDRGGWSAQRKAPDHGRIARGGLSLTVTQPLREVDLNVRKVTVTVVTECHGNECGWDGSATEVTRVEELRCHHRSPRRVARVVSNEWKPGTTTEIGEESGCKEGARAPRADGNK